MTPSSWLCDSALKPQRRADVGVRRLHVAISTPQQQISSVVATRDFLLRVADHRQTPRVPGDVRGEARALLRHYPLPGTLRPILEQGLGHGKDGAAEARASDDSWRLS